MNYFVTLLDHYGDNVQLFLSSHIVLAPLLLLFAEESGIPLFIPGDAIIGYVGYRLAITHTGILWEAFILALLAVIFGSTVLFYISRRWGHFVLTKFSRYIFLPQKHLDRGERLFKKYGIWAIIFGRHIPGLRIPITIFAATSGVKYLVFILGTILSTALWILFYLSVGSRFGVDIQNTVKNYVGITTAVIVTLGIVSITLHFRGRTKAKISNNSKKIT